jgi:hypothetical protein
VTELAGHLEELKANHAVFVYVDGSKSEPMGPRSLAKEAVEADGAVAIVLNGPVSKRTLEIASEAAIQTVLGTEAGKEYGKIEDVESWLTSDF